MYVAQPRGSQELTIEGDVEVVDETCINAIAGTTVRRGPQRLSLTFRVKKENSIGIASRKQSKQREDSLNSLAKLASC